MDSRSEEGRTWQRFLIIGCKVFVCPDKDQKSRAVVVDDSFGGLGLELQTTGLQVDIGQRVWVEIPDGKLSAFVRNISHQDDGSLRIGLEWEHPGTFRSGDSWVGGDRTRQGW